MLPGNRLVSINAGALLADLTLDPGEVVYTIFHFPSTMPANMSAERATEKRLIEALRIFHRQIHSDFLGAQLTSDPPHQQQDDQNQKNQA